MKSLMLLIASGITLLCAATRGQDISFASCSGYNQETLVVFTALLDYRSSEAYHHRESKARLEQESK
jgi:hypothetical protein